MPIYEYSCTSCGSHTEVLQKMNGAPLTKCPVCGKHSMKKLVSAAGFQLKGKGWYATDFKGTDKPKKDEPKVKSGEEKKPAAASSKGTSPASE